MANDADQPPEKKIIIDEDWKSQVQAEKERSASSEPAPPEERKKQPLPPPSMTLLLSMFATQAMIALGVLPHPATNKVERDLDQAKHFIDLLGLIEEKTKGNLSAEEKRQLDTLLFDLRMQFVESNTKVRS
jgi:hypothetical protein